ncbi:MAG: anthranilate synthase component I family protein [Turneriella sp.]|nr:anthranilate synthase component I family protein [Turneriella sp.]
MQLPTLLAKPVYTPFAFEGDFFALFSRIEPQFEQCFLLESLGEHNYDSRYSVIGFAPEFVVVGKPDQAIILSPQGQQELQCYNPYYFLRTLLPQAVLSRHYAGGLVGYLGYDAANFFEPTLRISFHKDFPPFVMGYFTDGLLYDKMTGEATYFYFHRDRREELMAALATPKKVGETSVYLRGQSKQRAQHAAMVAEAREEILAGNTFQVQIGLSEHYQIRGDWLNVYAELRRINPSPHMYFMKFTLAGKTLRLVGASPELLYRQRQGEMETFPLAGTTRRGATAEEDQLLIRELLSSPKEIAEHNMLVDLHRNDLGRVARYGTVKVRRIFDIKKFSHVQHISSEVVGILAPGQDMFTALASVFPAGTLSGAPKIESMKIIDRIEKEPRGPYGGAVGHFGFNGDCTFAIPIRTIFGVDDHAFIRASGGIVYDSTAEGEYQEIQNKLAATRQALARFMPSGKSA